MVLVAITGTPGIGKSSACDVLAKRGYVIVDLDEVTPGHIAEGHFAADTFSGALVEPPVAREIPAPEEIAAALAAGS